MEKTLQVGAAFIFLLLPIGAQARVWSDIVLPTVLNPVDARAISYLVQTDPFYGDGLLPPQPEPAPEPEPAPPSTPTPTSESYTAPPTQSPTTAEPTIEPSAAVTEAPTTPPTQAPTESPTDDPTSSPTPAPTETPDPYPENPLPARPSLWYFNYNTSDYSMHGPGELGLIPSGGTFRVGVKNNQWGSVANPPEFYWKEFTNDGWGPWKGVLANRDVTKNMCEFGVEQSPIDVRENGAVCDEHHEVRSLPGDYRVRNTRVQKQIHPNKLRLVYERRPCADLNNVACQEPDPPYADFPNGWGGFADVLHIDIKVTAEHRIWAEQFDAEMQIFHIHPGRRRLPTQSVLIRAEKDGYNAYFQRALNAFQYEYELNRGQCALRLRRDRQLVSEMHSILGEGAEHEHIDYATWADFSTDLDRPDLKEHSEEMDRLLESSSWDPHHPDLIPTIHFYRYDGSLTEPPCGEWVSWFVADIPMIISLDQLEQLKNILFNNYDEDCQRTSVHYGRSVARPIRPIGSRPVWKCTEDDFGPDP